MKFRSQHCWTALPSTLRFRKAEAYPLRPSWSGFGNLVGTIMFFNQSLTNIVTITFLALIIIELLNAYSSVSSKILIYSGASNPVNYDCNIDDDYFYLHYLKRVAAQLLPDQLHHLEHRAQNWNANNCIIASAPDRLIHRGKLFPRRIPESHVGRRRVLVTVYGLFLLLE